MNELLKRYPLPLARIAQPYSALAQQTRVSKSRMREFRTSGSVGARRAVDGGLPDRFSTLRSNRQGRQGRQR
jgi:hypothetical protein